LILPVLDWDIDVPDVVAGEAKQLFGALDSACFVYNQFVLFWASYNLQAKHANKP
jgi:hypothetical protein